jgi:phasin family protein
MTDIVKPTAKSDSKPLVTAKAPRTVAKPAQPASESIAVPPAPAPVVMALAPEPVVPAPAPEPGAMTPAIEQPPAADCVPPHPDSPAPIPAAPITAAAPPGIPVSETKDATMETIQSITEKTKSLFTNGFGGTTTTDFTEQAKGAMEKSAKMAEDFVAFGKGNIEALVESSKIAAKNVEALGQEAADYAKTSFEHATEAAKTLAAAKSPTEFVKLQSDYARTAFDTMIAEGSRSTERMLKMFGEFAQPISNRVAVATDKMKMPA